MSRQQPPPVQWLVVFEAVARSLSFKRAAIELNVSSSAVSQQIKVLEDWLGQPLFERHTRRVSLTAAGVFYCEVAATLVQQHRRGYSEFLRRFQNCSLHVSAPLFVAQDLMIPNYLSFREFLADTELRIEARSSYVDFDVEPLDAAIRFGSGLWSELDCRLLCPVHLAPVCSADYLAAHPMQSLEDLRGQKLIAPMEDLTLWRRLLGENAVAAENFLICDSYLAAVTSATQGLGVTLALLPSTNSWINDGRLVLPLGIKIPTSYAYWMVAPKSGGRVAELEAFYRWAQSLFSSMADLKHDLKVVEVPAE